MTPVRFNEVRLGSGRPAEMSRSGNESIYASSDNKSRHYALTVIGDGRVSGELIEGVYVCSADSDLGPTNEPDQLAAFLSEADRDYGDMLKRLAD